MILNKIYARSLILDGACYVEDLTVYVCQQKINTFTKKIQQ